LYHKETQYDDNTHQLKCFNFVLLLEQELSCNFLKIN